MWPENIRYFKGKKMIGGKLHKVTFTTVHSALQTVSEFTALNGVYYTALHQTQTQKGSCDMGLICRRQKHQIITEELH